MKLILAFLETSNQKSPSDIPAGFLSYSRFVNESLRISPSTGAVNAFTATSTYVGTASFVIDWGALAKPRNRVSCSVQSGCIFPGYRHFIHRINDDFV